MRLIGLILLGSLTSLLAVGQDRREADGLFEQGNFEGALLIYNELKDQGDADIDLYYRIGVCYLNTNIDKSLAIDPLEKVVQSADANPNALYLLGRAYHFGYQFDKAIEAYDKFRSKGEGHQINLDAVSKQIQYCNNAREIMKFPLNVTIQNLGANINSPYKDYYPFIPENEGFIVFNSKREFGEVLPNGTYTSDIYIAKVKNGEFQKATRINDNINTSERNEEIVGLTADGQQAIIFIEDLKSQYGDGNLFVSKVHEMRFDKPNKVDRMINSKDGKEIAASMSADGTAIYFASQRPGGYGGIDIYVSRLLPNGRWAPAQNLGPTVNTSDDEDFPHISPDGNTLFFSSKGHTGMGGYDIYKATWDPAKRKFNSVENMRFPINTPDDDMNFMLSETGRYGYMSSLRSDGYGDYDIYRVTFNEIEPQFSVITGNIIADEDTFTAEDVFLAVIDNDKDQVYGDYKPTSDNLKYVIILPPGNYTLKLEIAGYEPITEEIEVLGKTSFKSYISKDIVVKKL